MAHNIPLHFAFQREQPAPVTPIFWFRSSRFWQAHAHKVSRRIAVRLDWAASKGDYSSKLLLAAIVARNKEST